MAIQPSSLKAKQRLRVFDAYRGRGRRTNALWLVYSFKTNRDWILSGDRRLVHWLVFLESNPVVRTFDLICDNDSGAGEGHITVELKDGRTQSHAIVQGLAAADYKDHIAREVSRENALPEIVVYSDFELRPVVPLAMRWLKAIAFAATMRDEEHAALRTSLVVRLHDIGEGKVGDILEEMLDFDSNLVLGMLVRLAIEGHVQLDLTKVSFCAATPWNFMEVHENAFS